MFSHFGTRISTVSKSSAAKSLLSNKCTVHNNHENLINYEITALLKNCQPLAHKARCIWQTYLISAKSLAGAALPDVTAKTATRATTAKTTMKTDLFMLNASASVQRAEITDDFSLRP